MKISSALFSFLCLAPLSCFGSECTKVKCETIDRNGVMLKFFSGHVIANHTIVDSTPYDAIKATEHECVQECIRIKKCLTILVSEPAATCWFYDGEDVYANPERLQKNDGYKVISLGNGACRNQPCNFGKCIPLYNRGKYECECLPGYVGKKCDQAVGPAAHFSFDSGTVDDNTVLSQLKITLKSGRLVTSPERRGKVVYVGNDKDAFDAELTDVSDETTGWFRNFFLFQKNFTLTMWLKMDDRVNTDKDRVIFSTKLWSVSYNDARRMMKWKIGVRGDYAGNSFELRCYVPDIRRWTYFAFAASGVVEQTIAKQYVDGELCSQKELYRDHYNEANDEWRPTEQHAAVHKLVQILVNNQGLTLLDELKVFQSFPESDEEIKEKYYTEKRKLMS